MVKRGETGKIIDRQTGGTFFDVRNVPTYQGEGKMRKVISSEIWLFHAKHKVKGGFKTVNEATIFALENNRGVV